MKILQWNIRSVFSNIDNLKVLIQEYKFEIITLNETWLKKEYSFKLNQYNVMRKDRHDGKGGIAILIKNNIEYTELDLNPYNLPDKVQIQAIKLNKSNLNIINIYIPPLVVVPWNLLKKIIQSIPHPKVVVGDLNGQHPLWGSGMRNTNGLIVAQIIEESSLVLFNDGTPTRLTAPGQNRSAPDISLGSPILATKTSWSVIGDCGNSDHYPIIVEIGLNLNECHMGRGPGRNLKRANWELYHDKMQRRCLDNPPKTYQEFENILLEIIEEVIPQKKLSKEGTKKATPWWDGECDELIRERRRELYTLKENYSIENYIKTKGVIAKTKLKFKTKKKSAFQKFCGQLNRNTPVKEVWKTIKIFSSGIGGKSRSKGPSEETALKILDNLNQVNIDPDFIMEVPEGEDEKEITLTELNFVLNGKSDSAPGIDGITYSMLKNLPMIGKSFLVEIFNGSMRSGRSPEPWKSTIICPILKENGDEKVANNYRPIALEACAGKLMQGIIKNRMEWTIEKNQNFSSSQIGFRRGKGCMECLAYLILNIQRNFQRKLKSLVVFLDIKAAYDHVNIYHLYKTMKDLDISPSMKNWIFELLTNRKVFIRDREGLLRGPKEISTGLAQGSPLSPILFNIYTRGIHDKFQGRVKIIQYADDFTLFIEGVDVNEMVGEINLALSDISTWFGELNFTISARKSAAMMVEPRSHPFPDIHISYRNESIPWVKEYKYLGVIISDNLNWTKQIEGMALKAGKAINVIKSLTRVWWGGDPRTLLQLYKGIIRTHLDYGSQFISPTTKRNKIKLDTIQFQALRVVLGCMRSTPTNLLLAESGEESLELRRIWLAKKFVIKNIKFRNNIIIDLIKEFRLMERNKGYFAGREVPYLVQMYGEVEEVEDKIRKYETMPVFEFELTNLISEVPTIEINTYKNDMALTEKFLTVTREKFKNYIHFYTDASVLKETNEAGFGVHCAQLKYNFSSKLPKFTQICTAEIIGIHKATSECLRRNIGRAVIFTDSQSAVKAINGRELRNQDFIRMSTKQQLIEANEAGLDIRLCWIPGHANIDGNEIADKLANVGRSLLKVPYPIQLDVKEYTPELKRKHKQTWKEIWKISSGNKGNKYKHNVGSFQDEPWFNNLEYLDRRHITTIIRMRTGHCLTPVHLHRLGIRDSPECECGEVGSLEHLVFECQNLQPNLYDIFIQNGVQTPISIDSVIFNPMVRTSKLILEFLKTNNMKL